MELQGDIMPVLRCAATGRFLSTEGATGAALNAGFFAVRPRPELFDIAVSFGQRNMFSAKTGWGSCHHSALNAIFGTRLPKDATDRRLTKKRTLPLSATLAKTALANNEQIKNAYI